MTQTIKIKQDYASRRRQEYPPLSDQIGALIKGGQELIDMRVKVQAVKTKYPKPTPGA